MFYCRQQNISMIDVIKSDGSIMLVRIETMFLRSCHIEKKKTWIDNMLLVTMQIKSPLTVYAILLQILKQFIVHDKILGTDNLFIVG